MDNLNFFEKLIYPVTTGKSISLVWGFGLLLAIVGGVVEMIVGKHLPNLIADDVMSPGDWLVVAGTAFFVLSYALAVLRPTTRKAREIKSAELYDRARARFDSVASVEKFSVKNDLGGFAKYYLDIASDAKHLAVWFFVGGFMLFLGFIANSIDLNLLGSLVFLFGLACLGYRAHANYVD